MGRLCCYSSQGKSRVSVIGLHNGLLMEPFTKYAGSDREYGMIQKNAMQKMIADCPSSYIFKHAESLVIRIRPGFSNDTFFLPHLSAVPVGGAYRSWPTKVVVNGQEVTVETSGTTQVYQVMGLALEAAGYKKEDIGRWKLTTDSGTLMHLDSELSFHGVLGLGQTLFLNLPAGVGA